MTNRFNFTTTGMDHVGLAALSHNWEWERLCREVDAVALDYAEGRIDWFEHRRRQEKICDKAGSHLEGLLKKKHDALWQTRRK